MNDAAAKIAADFLSMVPAARAERVSKALHEVLSAQAAGSMRNVAFKDAKSVLDHAAEAAFRTATESFWVGKSGQIAADAEVNEALNKLWDARIGYVRDAIAVSKKLAKVKVSHAMVDAMRAVVAKVLPLALVMEQVKAKVVKGRENAIPSGYIRTRENTGTCPVCFRNIKLNDDKTMVLHGYERPGHGYIVGNCFTVNRFQSYELSAEGTKAFLVEVVRPMLARAKDRLTALKSGQVKSFTYDKTDYSQRDMRTGRYLIVKVTVREGDPADYATSIPSFEDLLYRATRDAQASVEQITEDEKFYAEMVRDWKLAPLPMAGSLVKDGK